MPAPTWTDQLAAWSTFATAVLTGVLVVAAFAAWRTAKETLHASRDASNAAQASAIAAERTNEQMRLDSIEQTRPYVYAEVLPGLAGSSSWDLKIANVGRSPARNLILDYDRWPDDPDDVASSVQDLFRSPRTLPPGCSIRVVWRLVGPFTDGSLEAGLGEDGRVILSYIGDDPSGPTYRDSFDVMISRSGLWPIPESGPNPDKLVGDQRKFYLLAQALVRSIGEFRR